MGNNTLKELGKLGQSVWLDSLSRRLITSGRLSRFIEEDGVKGITTNPTIFQKAISGSADYDALIRELLDRGITNEKDLFISLAIRDVSDAAELLMPVYDATRGRDGYVSIEVSPDLAYDPEATIKEAEYLFSAIDRKNILIKVPATAVCIPAIEHLISEGINVNVTLLFSVKRYEEVAESYIRGIEKRAGRGLPVDRLSSVASFFVSRVDTLVDRFLNDRLSSAASDPERDRIKGLAGRAAVANARKSHVRYLDIFSSKRFLGLKEKGAVEQRLLWASTGTKNPAYSDVKYVEELIAPDTVNTMPEQLIDAFRDHGRLEVSIRGDGAETDRYFSGLRAEGIDIEEAARALEEEGVRLFADSFRDVLGEVAKKRDSLAIKR